MSEWISVKSKIPNDEKMVLVTVAGDTTPFRIVTMDTYVNKYGCFLSERKYQNIKVVAWMSLPPVYEGNVDIPKDFSKTIIGSMTDENGRIDFEKWQNLSPGQQKAALNEWKAWAAAREHPEMFVDEITYSKSSIDGLIDRLKAETPYEWGSTDNSGEYAHGWDDALNRLAELLYEVED